LDIVNSFIAVMYTTRRRRGVTAIMAHSENVMTNLKVHRFGQRINE